MRKAVLAFIFILVLLFTAYSVSYAHHKERVLGTATSSSNIQLPPTTEGPGYILPDSPFFFLDKLKQQTRLVLAFTPEAKAKLHTKIAGERLAELKFMLAKNNKKGINTALDGVADNFKKATEKLTEAQLSGKDIKILAKEINDDIKLKRKSLDLLEIKSDGEIKARVKLVQESVEEAKVEVEEILPEEDIEKEVMDTLNRKTEREINDATESAINMSRAIEVLTREASDAAAKSQERREQALLQAIERKNENLKRLEEKKLEIETKKQQKLLQVNEEARVAAEEAVRKAKEAAIKYEKVKQTAEELKNETSNNSDLKNSSETKSAR